MLVQFEKKWAQENLVFKGGTCLKKCYFEKYCFSQNELELITIYTTCKEKL